MKKVKVNEQVKKWVILLTLAVLFFTGGYYWAYQWAITNAQEYIKYRCKLYNNPMNIQGMDPDLYFHGELNLTNYTLPNNSKFLYKPHEEKNFRDLLKWVTT